MSYLAFPGVLACGGSWMVKPDWINSQDFGQIKEASSEAIRLIKEAK